MSGTRTFVLAVVLAACAEAPTATRDQRPRLPHLTVIPGGQTCIIDRPGTGCVTANWVTGYHQTPNTFAPFQRTPGTGAQAPLTVGLSPVRTVCVYANDIDLNTNVGFRTTPGGNTTWILFQGDGNWTTFSHDSICLTAQTGLNFDLVTLGSHSNDYVNWNVTFKRLDSDQTWCRIESAVTSCNGAVASVSPSFVQSTYLTPFHGAVSGTSRDPVEILFSEDLYRVQVTAVDTDAPGTHMIAYDASGNVLQQVDFGNDNTPTRYTQFTQAITNSVGIRRIRLVSAASDEVAFKALSIERGGYSLSLTGSSTMGPGNTCYYYASPSGGVAPYTYQWSWTTSDGGSAGGYSPSNGVFLLAAQSSYGTVHLTVVSTDATGNTATATKSITISPMYSACSGY